MSFRHVLLDAGVAMAGVISAMQSNPLPVMVDLHVIGTVDNAHFLSDVSVRDGIKMPVFTHYDMVMLLHFGPGVMLHNERGFGQGLQECFLPAFKQLLSAEHLLLKVDQVKLLKFFPDGLVE